MWVQEALVAVPSGLAAPTPVRAAVAVAKWVTNRNPRTVRRRPAEAASLILAPIGDKGSVQTALYQGERLPFVLQLAECLLIQRCVIIVLQHNHRLHSEDQHQCKKLSLMAEIANAAPTRVLLLQR